jgi:hypothetical protein
LKLRPFEVGLPLPSNAILLEGVNTDCQRFRYCNGKSQEMLQLPSSSMMALTLGAICVRQAAPWTHREAAIAGATMSALTETFLQTVKIAS